MDDTLKPITGHCLCGEVTITIVPRKAELGICHCEMCRRWTGAAFVEIDAEPGTLKAEGPVTTFKSSDWAERANCGRCGSPLWYHLTLPGTDFHAVSAGLFDDAGGLKLGQEIYIDQKPAGYAFAGDHVRLTKQEFEARIASQAEGEGQ